MLAQPAAALQHDVQLGDALIAHTAGGFSSSWDGPSYAWGPAPMAAMPAAAVGAATATVAAAAATRLPQKAWLAYRAAAVADGISQPYGPSSFPLTLMQLASAQERRLDVGSVRRSHPPKGFATRGVYKCTLNECRLCLFFSQCNSVNGALDNFLCLRTYIISSDV